MTDTPDFQPQCPLPGERSDCIQLAHGGGGQLSHNLLQQLIYPRLGNAELNRRHDSALLDMPTGHLAFTTDSYVVKPLIFPGGDIGKLAVYGTVNDLLMAGAVPRYLSCSLILEEGLPLATLERILDSMAEAAAETAVEIVTGDTKVVDRGHGDGIYINSAGIGVRHSGSLIAPQSICPGDQILLSADIGRHGLAIMAQREGLHFEPAIVSDCAALSAAVVPLLQAGIELHCLRDLTRGGLASALVELAQASNTGMAIREERIAVQDNVRGGCELLGLDPLYIANEGCFIALLPSRDAERALAILQQTPLGQQSAIIGEVNRGGSGVTLHTAIGSARPLRAISGQPLPRIC